MTQELGAAMRRALTAVRGGDVSEATSIIQQALGGGGSPEAFGRMRRPLREVVRTLRDGRRRFRPSARPAPVAEPAVAHGATFLEAVHAEAAGSRRYRLYRPASLDGAAPQGLVLMLHGCTQTPEDFARGTRMNALAETHRLLVAYPEQTRTNNANACWNWFRPGDQARGAGEPAILAGLAQRLAADYGVPEGRVFVAGLSAGGAMAAVLGAAYPDVFAAVGVHSGVPHGSANDVLSAFAVMRGERGPGAGPDGLLVPLIVFHGDADGTVHPVNAERLAAAGRETGAPRGERGEAGGRGFTRWALRGDAAPALEYWLVEGAGHAWSGGDPAGSYADRAGPDASAEMVRFFLAAA
jgi:poly(hydroxyalkanoate) depolymerase family esterase